MLLCQHVVGNSPGETPTVAQIAVWEWCSIYHVNGMCIARDNPHSNHVISSRVPYTIGTRIPETTVGPLSDQAASTLLLCYHSQHNVLVVKHISSAMWEFWDSVIPTTVSADAMLLLCQLMLC